ncbi:MAG: hypothetical protein P4L83_14315 [Nevskia sp.]|nr:hypothetical protein [Nevskia sp.]
MVRQWLPHFVATYGERGRPTLQVHELLGDTLTCFGLGRPDLAHFTEAEAEYRVAISGYSALYGADSFQVLTGEGSLANSYFLFERYTQAIPLFENVYQGMGKQLGVHSMAAFKALIFKLFCLDESGRTGEAVALARTLLDQGHRYISRTDYVYRYMLVASARALLNDKRTAEASPLVDELSDSLAHAPVTQHNQIQRSFLAYLQGVRAQQLADIPTAIADLSDAVKRMQYTVGPNCMAARDARARLQQLSPAQAAK